MSDDRDTAGAAAGGGENTAPPTQPLRPTGKRSRQRSGATALAEPDEAETASLDLGGDEAATTKALRKSRAEGPTRNLFVVVFNYFGQVVAELRKVIWPNRRQMVNYTSVVLVFLVFMVVLIGLVDLGLAKLVLLIFGNKA